MSLTDFKKESNLQVSPAKAVFLHPPKTGGSARRAALAQFQGDAGARTPPHAFRQSNAEYYGWNNIILYVRDPVQRFISTFNMFNDQGSLPYEDVNEFARGFDEWWLELPTLRDAVAKRMRLLYNPQALWLDGDPENVWLYKMENMSETFPLLMEEYGWDAHLPEPDSVDWNAGPPKQEFIETDFIHERYWMDYNLWEGAS